MNIKDLQNSINNTKITRVYSYENFQKEWAWEDAIDKEFPIEASFKRLYRSTRRFIYNVPDMPRDIYRKIKRGIQRAYRGWADEDTWDFYSYHARVTYKMLIYLKNHLSGTAATLNPVTHEYDYDEERWKKILDRMIYAYKLNVDMANGDRESYSPYFSDDNQKEFKCLTIYEEAERRLGMMHFINYYQNLWD